MKSSPEIQFARGPRPEVLLRIDVPFGPRWQNVELLRISILHCVTTLFQSHDFCEQVAMVTAELLENAIQHGDWRPREPKAFRLVIEGTRSCVAIDVASPIEPGHPNVERLCRTVERIRGSSSVRASYVDRLYEVADGPVSRGSGLGLHRIAYETGCRLDASVSGDTARVVAVIGAPRWR